MREFSSSRFDSRAEITMIEHKGGEPEKLIELLRNKNLIDEVLVQSFDWDFLEAVHQLEPSLTIGALGGEELTDERLINIRRTGASMVRSAAMPSASVWLPCSGWLRRFCS